MEPLVSQNFISYWLLVVASLRLLSVVLGYFVPHKLAENVFPPVKESRECQIVCIKRSISWFITPMLSVTPLGARVFAVWTSMTCVLCVMTAYNMDDRGLYLATLISFVAALVFFSIELVVYKTMTLRSIAAMVVIAGEWYRAF